METLKMFMEDYEGFDFENGTIVLFDADDCKQYLLSRKDFKEMYLTPERLAKRVYDWKHTDSVMTIVLKGAWVWCVDYGWDSSIHSDLYLTDEEAKERYDGLPSDWYRKMYMVEDIWNFVERQKEKKSESAAG